MQVCGKIQQYAKWWHANNDHDIFSQIAKIVTVLSLKNKNKIRRPKPECVPISVFPSATSTTTNASVLIMCLPYPPVSLLQVLGGDEHQLHSVTQLPAGSHHDRAGLGVRPSHLRRPPVRLEGPQLRGQVGDDLCTKSVRVNGCVDGSWRIRKIWCYIACYVLQNYGWGARETFKVFYPD